MSSRTAFRDPLFTSANEINYRVFRGEQLLRK